MRYPCKVCAGRGFIEITGMDERAQRLLQEAAEDWKIPMDALIGPRRTRKLVEARRSVAFELRNLGMPLKTIGYWLGGRDHSTIIHLLNGKNR